jgi:inosine-uridine nucleoside N-ribohydrolase
MKERIWLDTDIGSDIDDAFCLAYLLAQPKAELLGISTVSGKAGERAALASAICLAAGRGEIPIFAGATHGLASGAVIQPECPQAPALASFPHAKPDSFGHASQAIEAMRRAIRSHPGEVTLLAIGPMTNLALLFAQDPELPGLLKRLVLMCGIFGLGQAAYNDPCYSEWNAKLDPWATRAVYRAAVAEHRSIGLDVTTRCTMEGAELQRRLQDAKGPLAVVAAMARHWGHVITFHDPLAGAAIFRPELIQWKSGEITVELGPGPLAGMTVLDSVGQRKSHQAAAAVDSKAFFEEYFGVCGLKA